MPSWKPGDHSTVSESFARWNAADKTGAWMSAVGRTWSARDTVRLMLDSHNLGKLRPGHADPNRTNDLRQKGRSEMTIKARVHMLR
jgi:hypothetical protein